MDRLDAMAVFVTVVEAGSLAAAARRLGHSPATVTRAVAMLEAGLGERLLHRSTRSLRLTERGERQVMVYRSVLAELAEADEAGSATTRITGRIVLTAPELFGQKVLMPILERFLDAHPEVSARVLLLNRVVNLVEEGWTPPSGSRRCRFRASWRSDSARCADCSARRRAISRERVARRRPATSSGIAASGRTTAPHASCGRSSTLDRAVTGPCRKRSSPASPSTSPAPPSMPPSAEAASAA